MKYIIMADGKGTRWNNYNGIPKHFIEINGERIIERTIRLLKKYDYDSKIIVTSHDDRYCFEGTERYEPKNNVLEIDRFTEELIEDNVCFLYGDCYYEESSIKKIVNLSNNSLLFFGNSYSIVAIKVFDSNLFKRHIHNVKNLYIDGLIDTCKGWQVYYSFENMLFCDKIIGDNFVMLSQETHDFNYPSDLKKYTR